METQTASHGYKDSDRSKEAPIEFALDGDGPAPLVDTNEPGSTKTKESVTKRTLNILKIPFKKKKIYLQPVKKYLDSKKEEDSKLRRYSTGKKDPTIPNKNILLVGETGAGKSTLINAMLNHIAGRDSREYEDDEFFTIMDEAQNQSKSQTKAITVYDLFGFHNENFPYSLTIIDTPGYGATKGLKEDQQIARSLQSLLLVEDGVKQLDAVGLVLKAGTNRLSDRQSYIFNSVVSLFGKDLEKIIVALITHSSGLYPSNELHALQDAKVKMARDENEPIYFLFNNCQNEFTSAKEKEKRARKHAWETSQDGMKEFLDFLMTVETQDLKQTADVLKKRIQLEACCNTLKERIDFIELKQKEIQQVKEAIGKLDNEAKNATTLDEVDEAYKELESIGCWWDPKATRCTICEENCHYPWCIMAWSPSWCEVMVGENCTSCAGKCHYSKHVKDKNKYVPKTRKVKKTVEDVQKKYKICEEKGQKRELLAAIEKDLEYKTKERENLIDGIYQCIVKLDEVALCSDSFNTYIHLEFVIKKLKEIGNDERVQKMNEVKNRIKHKQQEEENASLAYATMMMTM